MHEIDARYPNYVPPPELRAPPPPPPAGPVELAALRGRPGSPVALALAGCGPVDLARVTEGDCRTEARAGRFRVQRPPWPPPAAAPLADRPVTDEEARADIAVVMRRRFRHHGSEQAVTDALAIYDAPRVRAVTGDVPQLRAAAAELKGTFGEPALGHLLTRPTALSVRYGVPRKGRAVGWARWPGYLGEIGIFEDLRNEPPATIAPILFHELLHQGPGAGWPEELINNALDARLLVEMVRDRPEAWWRARILGPSGRTSLTALLNTRVGDRLAVERAEVDDVLPGWAEPERSFAAMIRRSYPDASDEPTVGHPTLRAVLRYLDPAAAVADDTGYSPATVRLLEDHGDLGPCDQMVAAEALGLAPLEGPGRGRGFARDYLDALAY